MSESIRYSFPHTVIYSEVDVENRMSLPAYSSLFQEAALLSAERLGFGESYCRREGRMWVLSRLLLRIDAPILHRDEIVVETWPKAPRGPLAMRDYRILDGEGAVRARATSAWLLLDPESMRPFRPQQVFAEFDFAGVGDALEESPPKVQSPADEEPRTGFPVRVRYSDLDAQEHVNNARYLRWLCDSFRPDELSGRVVRSFAVNYSRAAAWEDELAIERFDREDGALIRGRLASGEDSFLAQLELVEANMPRT